MMKRVIISILVALAAFMQMMPQADNRPIFTSWEQDKLYPVEYHPIPEQEYKRLDSIMRIDELMMLDNDTLSITPTRTVRSGDYSHQCVRTITPSKSTLPYLLVVVDSDTYDSIGSYVNRYAEDVHYGTGCGVKTEVVTNADFRDIKSLILSHQQNLMGATFVGDIDAAMYKMTKIVPKNRSAVDTLIDYFPCDLYFMDLDGEWVFGENDTIIDHTLNANPEIFVGRITSRGMEAYGNNMMDYLRKYFNRNHLYWLGLFDNYIKRAMTYTDKDWADDYSISNDIQWLYGYGYYDSFAYDTLAQNVTKTGYLSHLKSAQYSFVQLACHSSFRHHHFHFNNENLMDYEIKQDPFIYFPLGYNLYCCSACNWLKNQNYGYLGGAYLYSSTMTLFVVGSTKAGGMWNYMYFYSPMGIIGLNVGKALVSWWNNTCSDTPTFNQKWGHNGMVILGDPMIQLVKLPDPTKVCNDTLNLNTFDTSNISNLHYYRAASTINVEGSYSIPVGTHVIFDAPHVNINYGFTCPVGATFEVRQEGCKN